jgi:hypothetical protein
MIESRLSRFVKREVVAAPHAPPDGRCPGRISFVALLLSGAGGQFGIANTGIISKDRLDGNRKARVGR